jgi:hypothetical protein
MQLCEAGSGLVNIHKLKTGILQVNFYVLHALRVTYSAVGKICTLSFMDEGHRVLTPPSPSLGSAKAGRNNLNK